jgi:hypothetical protein
MKSTTKSETMKTLAPTITISIAFYGMLIFMLSTISFGFNVMTDEPVHLDANLKEMVIDFEEEAYIDDIPFDTKRIAEDYLKEENNFTK